MQPIDALTIRAVVDEIAPTLMKSKLDKAVQTSRDEVCLTLRQGRDNYHLLLSANSAMGRICLINSPKQARLKSQSAFGLALKKHLVAAQLVSIATEPGERIVDLTFSAIDELGSKSLKVLTAEIMGKHSNLIFWDKQSQTIIAASHNVTQEMSSKREVSGGLRYVRPPSQAKPNLLLVDSEKFISIINARLEKSDEKIEDILLSSFSGCGRQLAEDIVEATGAIDTNESTAEKLWLKVKELQVGHYEPAMRLDLTRYSLVPWKKPEPQGQISDWQEAEGASELVSHYYQKLDERTQLNQAKDELLRAIKSEIKKANTRLNAAREQKQSSIEFEKHKQSGDLILSNIHNIKGGEVEIEVDNFYDGLKQVISLDPNLSPSQNAQVFYKQFSKLKLRFESANKNIVQFESRLAHLEDCLGDLTTAETLSDLSAIKNKFAGREIQAKEMSKRQDMKPLTFTSSDGLIIIVGRNRKENDLILTNAKPHEIWLHVLGVSGGHVLIRLPASKQEPPQKTLFEAAFAAAYLSKAKTAGTVRVVWTHCRYVKKLGPEGLVRYEKEKTLEVDLTAGIPANFKQVLTSGDKDQPPHP